MVTNKRDCIYILAPQYWWIREVDTEVTRQLSHAVYIKKVGLARVRYSASVADCGTLGWFLPNHDIGK